MVFSHWSCGPDSILPCEKEMAQFVAWVGQHAPVFCWDWNDPPGYTSQLRLLGGPWVFRLCELQANSSVFFNGWVMTRHSDWWKKYNYILVCIPYIQLEHVIDIRPMVLVWVLLYVSYCSLCSQWVEWT
jgi:hypothetical protein